MKEKGTLIFYDCESYKQSENMRKNAIELTAEGFNIGLTEKYLYKGCLINVFRNSNFYILSDDKNLSNLEQLTSEENLPFEKGKKRQSWKFDKKEKVWKKSDNFYFSSPID